MTITKGLWLPFGVGVFAIAPWGLAYRACSARSIFLAALAGGAVALGSVVLSTKKGLITNDRNRWSLSAFQVLLWTWLVLSTMWTLVVIRIVNGADPVGFAVPEDLLILLGISGGSFVAAPLVAQGKRDRDELARHQTASDAGVKDFVTGDDRATEATIDSGRVQLLFFTIVCVLAYTATIAAQLRREPPDLTFPAISEGLVTLLGISHATYVANKLPSRQPVAATTQPASTEKTE